MIDWIDYKLKAWGLAKHRLMTKEEAWPESICSRIQDYGFHTDGATALQKFREGMTGDALEASLALFRAMHSHSLTDRQYEVVFVHYACLGYTPTHKRKALGYKHHDAYYECLDRAQNNLIEFFETTPHHAGV